MTSPYFGCPCRCLSGNVDKWDIWDDLDAAILNYNKDSEEVPATEQVTLQVVEQRRWK
jgi:hypothetical protein